MEIAHFRVHMFIYEFLLFALFVVPAAAQDAARVNPTIIKVEFENDKVRVLRALCKPHDRLEMQSHPAKAEAQITDGTLRIFTPNRKWQDAPAKLGKFFGSNQADPPRQKSLAPLLGFASRSVVVSAQ